MKIYRWRQCPNQDPRLVLDAQTKAPGFTCIYHALIDAGEDDQFVADCESISGTYRNNVRSDLLTLQTTNG